MSAESATRKAVLLFLAYKQLITDVETHGVIQGFGQKK
jgi:hypothetical protein